MDSAIVLWTWVRNASYRVEARGRGIVAVDADEAQQLQRCAAIVLVDVRLDDFKGLRDKLAKLLARVLHGIVAGQGEGVAEVHIRASPPP